MKLALRHSQIISLLQ